MSSRQRARRLADRIAKASSKVDGPSSKCTELRLLYNESALMTPLDPASTEWTELARQKAATSNALSMNKEMDERLQRIEAMIAGMMMHQNRSGMLMNQNQSSTVVRVKVEREEKAAVIIQAFLRTTLVRVKLERKLRFWGTWRGRGMTWVRYGTFDLGLWWKDYHRGPRRKRLEHVQRQKRASGRKLNSWSGRRSLLVMKSWGEMRIQLTCG